jgi:hypothetical protein
MEQWNNGRKNRNDGRNNGRMMEDWNVGILE